MAGLQTVLTLLPVISQGVSLFNNIASSEASLRQSQQDQELALQQLQQQQNLQQRNAQERAALERQKIALDTQIAEENRRKALKRAVARQRASFGSQGVSSSGGSSQAVLLGLLSESDEERAQRERLDTLRNAAINQDLGQQVRLNTLQRTQLQERNNLDNLSYGVRRLSNIGNFGVGALEGFQTHNQIQDRG